MPRCSPLAGAGWQVSRSRCRVFAAARRSPPQLARMEAEDLVTAVFPDQLACAENVAGDREIPDHPLTNQAIADCLHEAMDIEGLERLLARLEAGDIRVVTRDLTQPSPLALEVLSARPYAYLDDAPLEERRTQAVMARRWLAPENASELGRLDAEAIARVRTEAWPDPVNAEELHDSLLWLGCLSAEEAQTIPEWAGWLTDLARDNRVTRLRTSQATLWVAAERLPQFLAAVAHGASVTKRCATGGSDVAQLVARRSPDGGFARPAGGTGPGNAQVRWQYRSDWSRTRSVRRCLPWRPRASSCAAVSAPASTSTNGVTAVCSRGSITTQSDVCAPRSSRSPRVTSCVFCLTGSG